MKPFDVLPVHVDFAALERATLARWSREETFARSLDARRDAPLYTVLEGPPFATGLPHYGHLLTSFVKDVVPRYQTMRGYRVPRRFGWDCHGLPTELEAERALGTTARADVAAAGMAHFNDACRAVVLRYAEQWRATVDRVGRWVQWEHTYRTMDTDYTDSVLWCFRALHERGLVYEGRSVVPWCVRCQTSLSNFEARQDDATRARRDLALTVALALDDAPDESLWVWTTTPWTLPANVAVAVGPDVEYVRYARDGASVWVAAESAPRYATALAGYTACERVPGRALAGRRYRPLFPHFADTPGAFVVACADFVAAREGTGLVHLAPAYGEDDARVCAALGVAGPEPVGDDGCFTDAVPELAGRSVHEVGEAVGAMVRARGALVASERFEHNHPHCWRCDTPLVHRAQRGWFVRVSALRERLLAANAKVQWVPAHVGAGRFADWLANARDWAVSRQRFWGAPVPVWRCERCADVRVVGSRAELERLAGAAVTDLHRPAVDALTLACDACGGPQRRVPDVLDCWFESAAVPYAQLHWPFAADADAEFRQGFPADFVVEYVAQTRGWFYTLFVLAVALFDAPPFRAAVCHGVVLGGDGRKMSKRLQNYPDPEALVGTHGADALRAALVGSSVVRGEDARFSEHAVREAVRALHLPLWNAMRLFTARAAECGFTPGGESDLPALAALTALDRYLLAETEALRAHVEEAMARYDLVGVYARLQEWVGCLSTWYLRLTRATLARAGADPEKRGHLAALYAAWDVSLCVAAPFLPFLAEALHDALGGDSSVHLRDWPAPRPAWRDDALAAEMRALREVVRLGRRVRELNDVRHSQPLRAARVAGVAADVLARHGELLARELNVLALEAMDTPATDAARTVVLDRARLGPRLRGALKRVADAVARGEYHREADGTLRAAGEVLAPDEYRVADAAVSVGREVASENGLAVWLDLSTDAALLEQGAARELLREVQALRKRAGLAYTEACALAVDAPAVVRALLERHGAALRERARVARVTAGAPADETALAEAALELNGSQARLWLLRADTDALRAAES